MGADTNAITITQSIVFDPGLLEDGRYVITNIAPVAIPSSAFVDGVAEMHVPFVSNSILAIQQDAATVVLENLPDNLEFLSKDGTLLYFVIKGDCDIPLILGQ